jgi:hypothetical protein
MLHFLDNASAAKGMASVNSLVLHAPIHFLRPIDFLAVGKCNMPTVSDRLWAFAFKGENVSQERYYTRVGHGRHHSPHPEIYPVAARLTPPVRHWFLRERLGIGGPSIIFLTIGNLSWFQKWLEPISKFTTAVDPL